MNKMIEILPNIKISDNIDLILENSGINNIIIINIDINVDSRNNFIKLIINEYNPINFDYINNIILDILKTNENILILSEINLGFIIVCGFIIKYLNMSLIETLSLSKYYDIDLFSDDNLKQLFNYYNCIEQIN